MDTFLRVAGAVIVLVVVQDVFFTVLFPASGRGIIRKPLARTVWGIFRSLAGLTSGERRRTLLSYSGPVMITVTAAIWVGLLVIGWGMIYKPALGAGIEVSSAPGERGWGMALYYSGYVLTTLGIGDMVPRTGLYRLLTIVEAALGFATISMVITYFLSVYSNLTSRNAFAQGLHHLTGGTDDAAELLARLAQGSDLPGARDYLSSQANMLREIHQTHRFYPVLRYFHYREPYYELPRILLTALDTATLVRSVLAEERYDRVIGSVAVDDLFDAAMALMRGLEPGGDGEPSAEEIETWRRRYADAMARLGAEGLHVRPDPEAGADRYVELRGQWDRPVHALADSMLFEW